MKTVLVFIALLVAVQSNKLVPKAKGDVKVQCSETIQVGNASYTFYKCPKDYYGAVEMCTSKDKKNNLLSIHSHEFHVKVIEKLKHYNITSYEIWIGATKGKWSNTYYWTDGSQMDYQYWARGSPSHGFFYSACVLMETKEPGYWHDVDCYKRRPFVCESKPGKSHSR
ncbi:proteoglycan 3-like [Protopterus annectens]|uniref:proteoglycan 3-like n=1 Tax=Protopterus annectens TaxID=7888 RepID=UPI001CFB230A|nr:proteoglycan 3-like [Protopterus annectens]